MCVYVHSSSSPSPSSSSTFLCSFFSFSSLFLPPSRDSAVPLLGKKREGERGAGNLEQKHIQRGTPGRNYGLWQKDATNPWKLSREGVGNTQLDLILFPSSSLEGKIAYWSSPQRSASWGQEQDGKRQRAGLEG